MVLSGSKDFPVIPINDGEESVKSNSPNSITTLFPIPVISFSFTEKQSPYIFSHSAAYSSETSFFCFSKTKPSISKLSVARKQRVCTPFNFFCN